MTTPTAPLTREEVMRWSIEDTGSQLYAIRPSVLAALDDRDALRAKLEAAERELTRLKEYMPETPHCFDGECGKCDYCTDAKAWNESLGVVNRKLEAAQRERDELGSRLRHVGSILGNIDPATMHIAAERTAGMAKVADVRLTELHAARIEANCYRAARLTWPPHVLEAVARGDKSVCEEDAKRRHANWERMTSVARSLVALAEQESFEAEDIGDLADRARAALDAVGAK